MNEKSLPGHDAQPEGLSCNQCGHFVGPLNTCPNCGTPVRKRMSVRFFRWSAVFLATAGLVLLWMMSTRGEIPVLEVGSIQRTMNFAFVRIAGTVTSDARLFREGGRVNAITFTVNDGTGDIVVKAQQAKARELIARDLVPRAGDDVDVAGSLNVSADTMALWLASPDQMKLIRDVPRMLAVSELTSELEGKNVILTGVILEVKSPKIGTKTPWTMLLTDGTADQRVNIWDSTFEEIIDKVLIQPETVARVTGTVELYQEKLQIRLGRPTDIEFIDEQPADFFAAAFEKNDQTNAASLSREQAGETVRLQGTIAEYKPAPVDSIALHRLYLEGTTPPVQIVFKGHVADQLAPKLTKKGSSIETLGTVKTTSRDIMLRVYHPAQIRAGS